MAAQKVPVYLSYLLCLDLTSSTKAVWLAMQLDHAAKPSQRQLSRMTGISRPTISKALVRLAASGRPSIAPEAKGLSQTRVWIDRDLITDKRLPAMARVIYCILLGLRRKKRTDLLASYAKIAKVLGLQARTVRRAILRLVEVGWLGLSQRSQRAPLRFSFPNPKTARQAADVRRAEHRLHKSKYRGETLALLWCDNLVDSTNYVDDYFPQAFTNPNTNELLQADRYYFDQKVAIEFNGPQHDGPTGLFPEPVARAQIARDRVKQQICDRLGIGLITLRPEDLTLRQMKQILGRFLPLRPLSPTEPILAFLERKSRLYREAITRIRRTTSGTRKATTPGQADAG